MNDHCLIPLRLTAFFPTVHLYSYRPPRSIEYEPLLHLNIIDLFIGISDIPMQNAKLRNYG